MKKAVLGILLTLFLLLTAVLGYSAWKYRNTYIRTDTGVFRRDLTEIVLTDGNLPSADLLSELSALQTIDARNIRLSVRQYEQLRHDAPQAQILWMVPFQGVYLDEHTEILTVNSVTPDDIEILRYFPSLKTIDAQACRDYAAIDKLKEAYPDLDILYSVSLCGTPYSPDIVELALGNADISELQDALPYLTQLRKLTFTETIPDNEEIYSLSQQFPNVTFDWNFHILGVETSSSATMLDLSGIQIENLEDFESNLKYFRNLERVEMCDCGIPSDEMGALAERHPEIKFVWNIQVGKGKLRTDATAFIPYKIGYNFYHRLKDEQCTELKYCTDLVCLDMGHMDITDLSFLRYMPHMKYLIVADTKVTDFSPISELKELIYLEIFNVRIQDTSIFVGLTNLQDLNLCTTQVNSTEYLKQMTWLKRLWLVATHLSGEQRAEIRDALPDTQVVFYAEHSTAAGWRNHQNYRDMRDLLGMFYME